MQGGDDTRFCRGCGADVSNVLAIMGVGGSSQDGSGPRAVGEAIGLAALKAKAAKPQKDLAEKAVALNSRAVYGLMGGVGFLVISMIVRSRPPVDGILWLVPLVFAFIFFSAAVSRFVQSRGLKKLAADERRSEGLTDAKPAFLTSPARSIYDTDDLAPASVTERTTNLLNVEPRKER